MEPSCADASDASATEVVTEFVLPSGSFATVLLRELMQGDRFMEEGPRDDEEEEEEGPAEAEEQQEGERGKEHPEAHGGSDFGWLSSHSMS